MVNNRPQSAQDTGQVRLLTVPQVAEYLQVSVRLTWQLIELGKLPVVRIGRCVRLIPSDLDAYVIENRRGSP
ncbi:MAG: helix-turn-helix domain-containing protein [Candidatus Methylomirabilales bacterium]